MIGKYQLIQHLATGGMGAVYLVYHTETNRLHVIKKMLNSLDIESHRKHFEREIKIHQNLNHENIIHCIDVGFYSNNPFLVLEYAESGNLHDYYFDRKFNIPLKDSLSYFLSTIDGCSYLHNLVPPIIHRDFKPWNLLIKNINNKLVIKISDFGLSKIFDHFDQSSFTKIGDVKGSVAFMSPQQLSNSKDAGCQDDVFSLGVTFYYLLTGKFPYRYPSPYEIHELSLNFKSDRQRMQSELVRLGKNRNLAQMVLNGSIIPFEQKAPHYPSELAGIINKSIESNPQRRYQNIAVFGNDIQKLFETI
jgi:eukaryotic-like serine/threonine-protein kinase